MTIVLFGLAAAATGQALARSWKPAWQIAPLTLLLAVADRFLHYALFAAPLDSFSGLLFSGGDSRAHHGGRVLPCPRPQDGAAISVALRTERPARLARQTIRPCRLTPRLNQRAFAPDYAAC